MTRRTADVWVDREGVATPVREMSDNHLVRWVMYFRRVTAEQYGWPNTPSWRRDIDVEIQYRMVTAPAIYAEVQKRGLLAVTVVTPLTPPTRVPFPQPRKPQPATMTAPTRKIDLE